MSPSVYEYIGLFQAQHKIYLKAQHVPAEPWSFTEDSMFWSLQSNVSGKGSSNKAAFKYLKQVINAIFLNFRIDNVTWKHKGNILKGNILLYLMEKD